ncbi:hypothetical protein CALVIDRAFT_566868 [Calocera viscosa TUFC12733]|uniref:RNA-dependent RNA polymerase n=1 Tax=Calocera viscosa (strain TUFC12733) TaxID=1330018 RepID=A0A167J1Y2_CALVF|nr:hypothetical protein CALVIDRAFT_566868 [Calocera viscosa TUFC12733]
MSSPPPDPSLPSEDASPRPAKKRKVDSNDDRSAAQARENLSPSVPHVPKQDDKSEYCVLAHHRSTQQLLDQNQVAFGVQWELARLLSSRTIPWSHLGDTKNASIDITALSGSCADNAPKLLSYLSKSDQSNPRLSPWDTSKNPAFALENSFRFPWSELDVEQKAMGSPTHEGLGCVEPNSAVYHGKVHFVVSVLWKTDHSNPVIHLERPELGASTRFARRFGSRRFIRMKNIFHQDRSPAAKAMMSFYLKGFVFMGRVYRAFCEKDGTVHLVETNEAFDGRKPDKDQGDYLRMSLLRFLEWHNPMLLNNDQFMTKWASRFSLGLSTTVPGVRIRLNNVHFIDDEISTAHTGPREPASHHQLTDGCGFLNGTAMRLVAQQMGWGKTPAAVQARFGGCKGMFALRMDPHKGFDFDGEPAIWIRDSQVKIKYNANHWDPAMLIVDVVKPPRLRSPARLSAETIVVLADRGVQPSVLLTYLREGVSEQVRDFFDFENKTPFRLWLTISHEGGVIGARMKRAAAGAARAQGLGVEDRDEHVLLDDEEVDVTEDRSAPWWRDEISGCPSTIEESALSVIDSGFTLQDSSYLRRKVQRLLEQRMTSVVSRHKLRAPNSAEGFAIPCPLSGDILKPGQVCLHMSRPVIDPRTGLEIHVITGPVLLGRHPYKLPSDFQLVEAVNRPELQPWPDVIITSVDTSQPRSLLSKLAGGDYDGDIVSIFWDANLIKDFQNASDEFLVPPPCVEDFFECSTATVQEFLEKAPKSREQRERKVQECLLASLGTPGPGMWSVFHDQAVYRWGLSDERAVILAHMFTTSLDGAKSGKRIEADIAEVFRQELSFYPPEWKMAQEKLKKGFRAHPGKRQQIEQPDFVMEKLRLEGQKLFKEHLGLYLDKCKEMKSAEDDDLVEPWKIAERLGDEFGPDFKDLVEKEVKAIAKHVNAMRKKHRTALQPRKSNKGSAEHQFATMHITDRQDVLRALSAEFAAGPPEDEVLFLTRFGLLDRVRASAAYHIDWELDTKAKGSSNRGTDFPFNVAMRALCDIKARARGTGHKTLRQEFYDGMVLHKQAEKLAGPK